MNPYMLLDDNICIGDDDKEGDIWEAFADWFSPVADDEADADSPYTTLTGIVSDVTLAQLLTSQLWAAFEAGADLTA